MVFKYSFIFLIFALANADERENCEQLCSFSEPQNGMTCVEIKFPWMTDSVYFCTDQEFSYKKCNPAPDNVCYNYDNNNATQLIIKGPWNCCPQITQTNPCLSSGPCMLLPPYNRTYQTWSYEGSCCDTYFTGPGASSSDCYSQSSTLCPQPPENITTTVYDNYGCCTYYELQGDPKPGSCPKTLRGYYYADEVSAGGYYSDNNDTFRYCIGDSTCPDKQKCCKLYEYDSTYQCMDPCVKME